MTDGQESPSYLGLYLGGVLVSWVRLRYTVPRERGKSREVRRASGNRSLAAAPAGRRRRGPGRVPEPPPAAAAGLHRPEYGSALAQQGRTPGRLSGGERQRPECPAKYRPVHPRPVWLVVSARGAADHRRPPQILWHAE